MINLCATYRSLQSRLKGRTFYSQVGVSINVTLLSENHHKTNLVAGEEILYNEGVVPL